MRILSTILFIAVASTMGGCGDKTSEADLKKKHEELKKSPHAEHLGLDQIQISDKMSKDEKKKAKKLLGEASKKHDELSAKSN